MKLLIDECHIWINWRNKWKKVEKIYGLNKDGIYIRCEIDYMSIS